MDAFDFFRIPSELTLDRPEHLVHYTTAQGLKGIIEGRCLWTTHINHLNDRTEFDLGRRLGLAHIEELEAAGVTDGGSRYLGYLRKKLEAFEYVDHYVASFATAEDLLSQWRGYSQGGGFCLRFSTERLLPRLGREAQFGRCEYVPERQKAIVRSAIDEGLEAIANPRSKLDEPASVGLRVAVALMVRNVFVKDRSFQEEGEWRVLRGPIRPESRKRAGEGSPTSPSKAPDGGRVDHGTDRAEDESAAWQPVVKYRPARGMLVPYVELELGDLREVGLNRIWVGPARSERDTKLSAHSVERLLRTNGISGVEVVESKSPYLSA